MSLSIEALFTAALGLQATWRVERAELSTAKRRMSCPHCGTLDQGIHERVRRSWRHLDFFQFEQKRRSLSLRGATIRRYRLSPRT